MYANEFETKEKQKLPEIKKLPATYTKHGPPVHGPPLIFEDEF